MTRVAGVLLHPTSLPGPYGMGDLGPVARQWLTELAASGAKIWQVLPLQPTTEPDPGPVPVEAGCPYLSPSAFALEPNLLSLDDLVTDGWLRAEELTPYEGPSDRIDHTAVYAHRAPLHALAAARAADDPACLSWAEHTGWVREWSIFRALQARFGLQWTSWPPEVRDAAPEDAAAHADPAAIAAALALQWLTETQWARLHAQAQALGVKLWGDMPIFVGLAACDVWAHRELWRLRDGEPEVVSGVPPDAFSPEGQRWGHPLYDVDAHRATGHRWWLDRAAITLARNDVVRIDHFRGLAAWWEIPAADKDARGGRWVPGLGAPLLSALVEAFGKELPFIAEDLGVITPDVEALRDQFGLPGMVVLQFAWDGNPKSPHHPKNHRKNQVAYTGTHDSDTAVGWADSLAPDERQRVAARMGCEPAQLPERLIALCLASPADTAILPAQDLLGLGADARFNVPGSTQGNWSWRLTALPDAEHWARFAAALREGSR